MKLKHTFLAVFIGALLSISCSKSDDSNTVYKNNPAVNSYWPLKLQNEWNYTLQNGLETYDILINEEVTYKNKVYFRVGSHNISNVEVPLFNREDLGVFTMYFPESNILYGGVNVSLGAGTIKFIDTNTAVGITWEEAIELPLSYSFAGSVKVKHVGKVVDNDIASFTTNGSTYSNVIKVETVQTITNSFISLNDTYKYTYWLAKDIGPVQIEIEDINGTQVYELVNYSH